MFLKGAYVLWGIHAGLIYGSIDFANAQERAEPASSNQNSIHSMSSQISESKEVPTSSQMATPGPTISSGETTPSIPVDPGLSPLSGPTAPASIDTPVSLTSILSSSSIISASPSTSSYLQSATIRPSKQRSSLGHTVTRSQTSIPLSILSSDMHVSTGSLTASNQNSFSLPTTLPSTSSILLPLVDLTPSPSSVLSPSIPTLSTIPTFTTIPPPTKSKAPTAAIIGGVTCGLALILLILVLLYTWKRKRRLAKDEEGLKSGAVMAPFSNDGRGSQDHQVDKLEDQPDAHSFDKRISLKAANRYPIFINPPPPGLFYNTATFSSTYPVLPATSDYTDHSNRLSQPCDHVAVVEDCANLQQIPQADIQPLRPRRRHRPPPLQLCDDPAKSRFSVQNPCFAVSTTESQSNADGTSSGVEPHPGPRESRSRRRSGRKSRDTRASVGQSGMQHRTSSTVLDSGQVANFGCDHLNNETSNPTSHSPDFSETYSDPGTALSDAEMDRIAELLAARSRSGTLHSPPPSLPPPQYRESIIRRSKNGRPDTR